MIGVLQNAKLLIVRASSTVQQPPRSSRGRHPPMGTSKASPVSPPAGNHVGPSIKYSADLGDCRHEVFLEFSFLVCVQRTGKTKLSVGGRKSGHKSTSL